MLKRLALISILLLTVASETLSADKNPIVINQAQARASVGNLPNSAAFLQIENQGKTDDALLSAVSPAAERIEIHSMSMEGDVMKMRAVDSLVIKAGQQLTMQPGQGYHVMLMGLKKPLKAGEKFALTLTFRNAGKIKVTVEVLEAGAFAKPAGGMQDHHEHHDH
ncbi:MAG: copper chaperone PCu(A)C [Oxalobacteraceae bacterium]